MKNSKLVAFGLIASLVLAVFVGAFEVSMHEETAEFLYGLIALGFAVFSVWGANLLLKK